jgi:hypothetical protein
MFKNWMSSRREAGIQYTPAARFLQKVRCGGHTSKSISGAVYWVPAFAGMTSKLFVVSVA